MRRWEREGGRMTNDELKTWADARIDIIQNGEITPITGAVEVTMSPSDVTITFYGLAFPVQKDGRVAFVYIDVTKGTSPDAARAIAAEFLKVADELDGKIAEKERAEE